jgi:MSHA biogenesis protein MshO
VKESPPGSGIIYLEFLPTLTGGRYRNALSSAPALVCDAYAGDTGGDMLAVGVSDTCFTTLGNVPNVVTVAGIDFTATVAYLVVYNLGTGFVNADAYTGGNRSQIVSVAVGAGGENIIKFNAKTYSLGSPGNRFQIVSAPISYVCDPGAGTLTRVTGYAIAAAQPTPAGGNLLAQNIGACTITYDQNVINQRVGVVSIWLSFTDVTSATNVNLFQQVQVSNVP